MPRFKDIPKTFIRVSEPDYSTPLLPLDYVKDHARIPRDVTDEDANLLSWITAAERLIEDQAEVAFRTQTWRLKMLTTPNDGPFCLAGLESIRLEILPVRSVSVSYYDRNEDLVVLPSGEYELETDHVPPLLLVERTLRHELSRKKGFPLIIECVAGTPPNELDLPSHSPEAALAICQLVAHWYRFRECVGLAPTSDHPEVYRIFSDLMDIIKWRLL
jgi:uncharacterized phiE125 gp8 family phage protein